MIKISTKGMYFSQAESTPANSGLVRTIPLKKPEKGKVSSDSSVPASLFCWFCSCCNKQKKNNYWIFKYFFRILQEFKFKIDKKIEKNRIQERKGCCQRSYQRSFNEALCILISLQPFFNPYLFFSQFFSIFLSFILCNFLVMMMM